MAKYIVLAKSYINSTLVEEGSVVDYDGEAGPNLELIVEEAEAVKPVKGKKAEQADGLV